MRVLFIGGTGNISTSCVEAALAAGHDVTLFTRGSSPSPFDDRVERLQGDRETREGAEAVASREADVVVDFVAYHPRHVQEMVRTLAGRVGQYVFISSTSVYQKPPPGPFVTEETPLENSYWEYAREKIACETLLVRAHEEGDFPVTIVRPSYTYGETWIPTAFAGHGYTIVDRMRRGQPVLCHGDGTSLWVMTHASDFASGLVGLLGNRDALGEAFHITSDEVLTWNRIYELIAQAAGCTMELVHVPSDLVAALFPERGGSLLGDKAHSLIFDNGKIRRYVPDYRPRVGFAEGIARSVAWFDADPARQVADAEANARIDQVLAAQGRAQAV